MRSSLAAALALGVAALGVAGPALAENEPFAIEGAWQVEGATVVTFGPDGRMDGIYRDAYRLDDDVLTVTASDDHLLCPGAVGIYEFRRSEDGAVTATRISDDCVVRNLDGEWVRLDERLNDRLIISS